MEEKINHTLNVNLSVDCVVVGFDNNELNVLLIKRVNRNEKNKNTPYKLPGSPIYADESLDDSAMRVLTDCTGLKNVKLVQYKAYGEMDRLRKAEDVEWLEKSMGMTSKPERMVTISYIAFVGKKKYTSLSDEYMAEWVPISKLKGLSFVFDHKKIIDDVIRYIRRQVNIDPTMVYDILPAKFTMLQLRMVYQAILDEKLDVRNFQKKIKTYGYIIMLDEKEQGVRHRAARFYAFDRKVYNKEYREKRSIHCI